MSAKEGEDICSKLFIKDQLSADASPCFPLPSPSAAYSAAASCSTSTLQPPSKLDHLTSDTKLSPSLKLHFIKQSSCPPPPLPRRVEPDHGAYVKTRMGLMKLRRQCSHPPAPTSSSCPGNFNQAAAARELMASLERLSMKEKPLGMMNEDQRELEAERALLAGGVEGEEGSNAGSAGTKNKLKLGMELPLTAKMAAAMDAGGQIGVQEEITLHCRDYKSIALQRSVNDQSSPASANFKAKLRSTYQPRLAGSAASSDCKNMHSATRNRKHCKRLRRWTIPRRVRSTRYLLGKLWKNLKKVFSASSSGRFFLAMEGPQNEEWHDFDDLPDFPPFIALYPILTEEDLDFEQAQRNIKEEDDRIMNTGIEFYCVQRQ